MASRHHRHILPEATRRSWGCPGSRPRVPLGSAEAGTEPGGLGGWLLGAARPPSTRSPPRRHFLSFVSCHFLSWGSVRHPQAPGLLSGLTTGLQAEPETPGPALLCSKLVAALRGPGARCPGPLPREVGRLPCPPGGRWLGWGGRRLCLQGRLTPRVSLPGDGCRLGSRGLGGEWWPLNASLGHGVTFELGAGDGDCFLAPKPPCCPRPSSELRPLLP